MRGSRMREVAALLPILLHGACALHATPSLHHPRSTSAMARRLDRLPHSLSLLHMRSEDDPLLISSEVSIIFAYAFARAGKRAHARTRDNQYSTIHNACSWMIIAP